MIRGTTPPEEIWGGNIPASQRASAELWHRESSMLERLIPLARGRRGAAVEVYCTCPKSHLTLSAFVLPEDEAAIWIHGGGRAPEGYLQTPGGNDYSAIPGLSKWYTMPDNFDIYPMSRLRAGHWIGNVWVRCGLPHTLSSEEIVSLSQALDSWRPGARPTRATLIESES